MKLSSSTGDFGPYVDTLPQEVACFKGTKFKYLNIELSGSNPEFLSDNDDDWKRLAEVCKSAAEDAGIKYVLSHAPCFHKPIFAAMTDRSDETYRRNVCAIRRSMEVSNALGVKRTVIHACPDDSFSVDELYSYNKMFYSEFFDLAEKYGMTILTENWDNDATKFSTGKQMREFIDSVDHPLLAACWDTAHGNLAKEARAIGQYENIVALGDKLKGLHISDNFGDVHHHSWPFAGIISFDQVMQGLTDIGYDGYFNFEASYTLLHHTNLPYHRKPWIYKGEKKMTLLDPSVELKQKAVDLLYETGRYILDTYDCFEE